MDNSKANYYEELIKELLRKSRSISGAFDKQTMILLRAIKMNYSTLSPEDKDRASFLIAAYDIQKLSKYKDIEGKINNTINHYDSLNKQINNLLDKNKKHSTFQEEILKVYKSICSSYSNMTSLYNDLLFEYSKLSHEYPELESKFDNITNIYHSIQEKQDFIKHDVKNIKYTDGLDVPSFGKNKDSENVLNEKINREKKRKKKKPHFPKWAPKVLLGSVITYTMISKVDLQNMQLAMSSHLNDLRDLQNEDSLNERMDGYIDTISSNVIKDVVENVTEKINPFTKNKYLKEDGSIFVDYRNMCFEFSRLDNENHMSENLRTYYECIINDNDGDIEIFINFLNALASDYSHGSEVLENIKIFNKFFDIYYTIKDNYKTDSQIVDKVLPSSEQSKDEGVKL